METVFKDRRNPEPESTTDERDSDRLRSRAHVKRKRAAATLALHRHGLHTAQIKALESEMLALADDHVRAASPIQSQIAEIDAQQLQQVLAGGEPDAALESRRLELLAAIDDANSTLTKGIAALDAKIYRHEVERAAQGRASNISECVQELFLLGTPELLSEYHAARLNPNRLGKTAEQLYSEIISE